MSDSITQLHAIDCQLISYSGSDNAGPPAGQFAADFRYETPEQSEADQSYSALDRSQDVHVDLLPLFGHIDSDFELVDSVFVQITEDTDGCFTAAIHELDLVEGGDTRVEAIENIIAFLVEDASNLLATPDTEMTQDAIERKSKYHQLVRRKSVNN